jgi:hypothetical protein
VVSYPPAHYPYPFPSLPELQLEEDPVRDVADHRSCSKMLCHES